jgi:hypothetical protein
MRPFPNLSGEPEPLYLCSDHGSGIAIRNGAGPGGDSGGKEGRVKQPRVLEAEDDGRGDRGCGCDNNGEVIGCGAVVRHEGGVWEG